MPGASRIPRCGQKAFDHTGGCGRASARLPAEGRTKCQRFDICQRTNTCPALLWRPIIPVRTFLIGKTNQEVRKILSHDSSPEVCSLCDEAIVLFSIKLRAFDYAVEEREAVATNLLHGL